jgi:hypothetical protein
VHDPDTSDTRNAHTSVEKVEALIEHQMGELGGAAQSAMLLGRQFLEIPDDPAVLDLQLARYAQLCLQLRSDGAPPLHVALADGEPLPLPE